MRGRNAQSRLRFETAASKAPGKSPAELRKGENTNAGLLEARAAQSEELR